MEYILVVVLDRVHRSLLFSSFQVRFVQLSCRYSSMVDSVASPVIWKQSLMIQAGLTLWSFIHRTPVHYRLQIFH